MRKTYRCLSLVGVMAIAVAGCTQTPDNPVGPSSVQLGSAALQGRSSDRCVNVAVDGTAALIFIEVAPGEFTLGGAPTPVTLADIPGLMSSAVSSLEAGGVNGQGAQHLTLKHTFESTAGMFETEDKAVCAPAGTDPNVCKVNDVLQIVSGTGVFAHADGVLRNHGVIDLNNFTVSFSLKGRVCGDGI